MENTAGSLYTWVDFYSEFADALLAYKDNRRELIAKLQRTYDAIEMKLPTLDSERVPSDIDPFTIFGLFTRRLTDAKRKKIIAGIAEEFEIEAAQPRDFAGVPVLVALFATFYAFSNDERRNDGDIDRLWKLFEAALAYADNPNDTTRQEFCASYDNARNQFGLRWKLTMGLSWIRPFSFVSLDSRMHWFLKQDGTAPTALAEEIKRLKKVPDSSGYLRLRDLILEAAEEGDYGYRSFPELSLRAWLTSEEENERIKAKEKTAQESSLGDADVETIRYWLYSPGNGASQWDAFYDANTMGIGWDKVGNLSELESKDDIRAQLQVSYGDEAQRPNDVHALWQFSHEMKPGDVVFVKKGRQVILGRGVVSGDYEYRPEFGTYPHRRKVEWSVKGSWSVAEPLAMKALTELTDFPQRIAEIESLFESDEVESEQLDKYLVQYPEYSKELFLDEVFMDEDTYDILVRGLKEKKNIILQGAPGVGKTFVAKRLAYSMMGVKDTERVKMVQFHQSYSYEDFVEGYRPTSDGFELTKGLFYSFCKKAEEDSDNDYFFVIDEINRGNLSKIFGELFMLIENDKRSPKNKLQLLYSRELFGVPSNVYLIGMMNTADRSLAMLDYALRRRFLFFNLEPGFENEGFRAYRKELNSPKFDALVRVVERLNEEIATDDSLGEGFCIGHSYLSGMQAEDVTDANLGLIVNYELIPMLQEYWFDEPEKVREWSERLRGAIK